VFTKYPTEVFSCDPNEDFRADMTDNAFRQNITKFTCADRRNISFMGTIISPSHFYFHYEMLACEESIL